jgi:hypothetical protein
MYRYFPAIRDRARDSSSLTSLSVTRWWPLAFQHKIKETIEGLQHQHIQIDKDNNLVIYKGKGFQFD